MWLAFVRENWDNSWSQEQVMKLLSNRDEILQDLCIHYANEQCHGHGHLIDIKIWEYQKVPINPIF